MYSMHKAVQCAYFGLTHGVAMQTDNEQACKHNGVSRIAAVLMDKAGNSHAPAGYDVPHPRFSELIRGPVLTEEKESNAWRETHSNLVVGSDTPLASATLHLSKDCRHKTDPVDAAGPRRQESCRCVLNHWMQQPLSSAARVTLPCTHLCSCASASICSCASA
eukprot:scaffold142792_cov18-Tisochrysis_lutea.AAC.2